MPGGMEERYGDPDPDRARRAMEAMFGMPKIDIAALRNAAGGAAAAMTGDRGGVIRARIG